MARYLWSKLKDATYPEVEDIRKAMQKADKEKESERDIRNLMSLLMRMVETSPRLRGHMLTRRTAVTSYDWNIVAENPADQEKADEVRARLQKTINAVLNRHTQTPAFGAMAIELEPVQFDGKWQLTIKRRFHPTEIERTGEDLDRVAVLEATGRKITSRTYPDQNPDLWIWEVDEDTVTQGGILRSLAFHEKLRHITVQEWANYNQKVKGMILAKYAEHASDDDIKIAKSATQGVVKHQYGVTSNAIEYDFQQTVSYIGAQSFKDYKAALEADESIAMLGQANTTELPSKGGSRAALQVLQLIRADIHYSDIVRIEQILMPQLLLADYRLNAERNAIAVPWAFKLKMAEDRDAEKEIRTVAEALQANVPLKQSEVYERIGYSAPTDEDETFEASPLGSLPQIPGDQ